MDQELYCRPGLFATDRDGPAFGARTLELSTIVRVPTRWVRDRISESGELQQAYALFSDWVRRRKSRREQSLICETATERFRKMQAREPDLVKRPPRGDVARYLGTTPIAFSRVKRRLGAGKK